VALQFTANTSLAKARQFVIAPQKLNGANTATSASEVMNAETVPDISLSKTCSSTVKQEFNWQSYDVCNWDDPANKVLQFQTAMPVSFCNEVPARVAYLYRNYHDQYQNNIYDRVSDLCTMSKTSSEHLMILHDDTGAMTGTTKVASNTCMLTCPVAIEKTASIKKLSKIMLFIPINTGTSAVAIAMSPLGLSDYTTPGTPVMMTPSVPGVGSASDSTGAADVPGGSDTQPSGMDGGSPATGAGSGDSAGISGTVVTGNTNAFDSNGGSGTGVTAANGGDQIDAVGPGAASGGTSSTASSNNSSSNNSGNNIPAAPVMQNIPSASSAGEDESGKKPASSSNSAGSGGIDGGSIGPGPGQVGGLGGGVMSGGVVGASGCTLILR